ncbi:BON1-associated protein 2 [Glycine soja]|uniref:BON1-associated protein 2 n=1 Tax=Glycine soja TaxID=3848 RepID=A0A0B2R0Q5_GLYSO|nr:BON1-associated protein 2 [Glycine soja]
MATKPKTLELTVLSAEGLHVRGKPTPNIKVFAVVRADDNGFQYLWNDKFWVELGPRARCVTIEVKCRTETGVVRDVGVARIAVSDFLGGSSVPDHCLQSLCYRLRDWDGRENGNVGEGFLQSLRKNDDSGFRNDEVEEKKPPPPPPAAAEGAESYCSSSTSGTGVVTGIPVYWNNSIDK